MKNTGFTMSEVLITLGVIGVIAAMTLPSVIKSYQKQVTVNRLKESYNTLSQAFQRAVTEHDAPAYWTYDDNNLDFFVETYIAPYIKIIKKSSTAPTHYNIDGKTEMQYYKYYNHYYLANGTEFTVYTISGYTNTHYFINIDINGIKGPNKYGRDVFRTQFQKTTKSLSLTKTFVFNGINDSFSDIKSNCKSHGIFCGAWIMREGWKIPDDYPW